MADIISNIGTVVSAIWAMMANEILPGITLKKVFLFFMCLAISVWCVRFLLFED